MTTPDPLERSHCGRCDMLDSCCPDDAIDCKDSESGHLCLGYPQYGKDNALKNLFKLLHFLRNDILQYSITFAL